VRREGKGSEAYRGGLSMGSSRDSGRDEGSRRRPGDPRRHRTSGRILLEALEERRLLSGSDPSGPWHPSNTNPFDVQNGPLANLGQESIRVYQDYVNYEAGPKTAPFYTPQTKLVMVTGEYLNVDVRATGDLPTYETALKTLGMIVTVDDVPLKEVEGYFPLAKLPQLASESQTIGGSPVYRPITRSVGLANNEADAALFADVARAQYKVDGTGQKIGILSDSIDTTNAAAGLAGLASSVASGDLPPNVQILPGQSGGANTDEGRAMLENVHDIAPGAALAFATATGPPGAIAGAGQLTFAKNIRDLATAGSTLIADDIGYRNELYYQDSAIQDSVNAVTAQGVVYASAAGNSADSGYQSNFRGVNATVTGIGAGRFHNFDPTGATSSPTIGVNVYSPTNPTFEFDQPQIAGSATGVKSQVNIYFLDANNIIVGSGTSNNVANQSPIQIAATAAGGAIPIGQYNVAIQVVSGPDPGHVVFLEGGDGGFNVDHKFGFAGGTSYTSILGHSAGATTISVGAVPWFDVPPFLANARPANEPFSSFGTSLTLFNADGSARTPQVLLKPDISGPDGGNTSFFPRNPDGTPAIFNTTQTGGFDHPPYPGEPPTTTNQIPTATNLSQPTLPSFFGTSAAVENVIAVAALIKQLAPGITPGGVLNDLTTTATALNGAAKGSYTPQGGFGLVNAPAALAAASVLRVASISPGGGGFIAVAPTAITVTFNKPVDINTVTAASLFVVGANGSTVTVGAPVGVDSATFPTVVRFPITVTPAPGRVANGIYVVTVIPGTIRGQSGQLLLTGTTDTFNLQQTIAPQVINTATFGRFLSITFSEPMNPATINQASVFVVRSNGSPNIFNPSSVFVSSLPGVIFSYNQQTNTAFFDLSALPQAALPTDHYAIGILPSVTDFIGNPLNGAFGGFFPSGIFPQSPTGTPFLQDLGVIQLTPPVVTALTLAPSSDTGIPADNNTNVTSPSLVGQVTGRFPTALGGLVVYAEFNGIPHAGVPRGGIDLAVGAGGRGFTGHFDVVAVTNAFGQFTIPYPAGLAGLPEGENRARVVVVGQPDTPPFSGLSSSQDTAFRVDRTLPYVGTTDGSQATSIPENAQINSLTSLTLNIVDPVQPQAPGDPFAVDPKLGIPALDPTAASNVQNYILYRVTSPTTVVDESSFIKTATFLSTSARALSSDPFSGQVVLTFGPGLPAGHYFFDALSAGLGYGHGLTDAAGNPFAGTLANALVPAAGNFQLDFDLQPTPTYITGYTAYSADPTSGAPYSVLTGPRSSYEIPVPGQPVNAPAPPTAFAIDFSNTLNNFGSPAAAAAFYSNAVQLVGSANTAGGTPDGDFGDFGITNSSGFTRVPGVFVQLLNSVPGAVFGQYGFNNRLLITLPSGASLPADYYRVYLPNKGPTAISDIYGSQLDGEFLGYQNNAGKYVNQLQNGQIRGGGAFDNPDLSGDGTPGGAFVTGFVVVPNGNVIFARPDAIYNPQIPGAIPNGSFLRPYPVLATEAIPTAINGGDLNSTVNSGSNFNPVFDRAGLGTFQPSAFFAAQQRVQQTGGPVLILAMPAIPSRDLLTGAITQRPFVLQAPAGSDPIANDASAAIPALTTLIFEPSSTLKLQNAALLVQNQGSALQILGGANPSQQVTFTSYKDSSVGGSTNGDPTSAPLPGDYGGIVFRNFSQAPIPGESAPRISLFPGQLPITGNPSLDNKLKGPFANTTDPSSQLLAVSGADDVMSYVNYLVEKYAGGPVPQTQGFRYDGITMQNSRPTITNTQVALSGGGAGFGGVAAGSAQAGLSVDVDSLRQDDTASGPLLRGDSFINDGLNGIYIRAQANGVAEPSNAIGYATNPAALGGSRNYVLNDPYPYLLTSRLVVGQQFQVESGGQIRSTADRLYVDPGMLVKFEHGAALQVTNANASLNVGDQTYIREYDVNHNVGPTFPALLPSGQPNPLAGQVDPNFRANSPNLAKAIFTSLNDDTATTSFFDPISQTTTTLVQPLPAVPGGSGGLQPTPGIVADLARWGGVSIVAGAVGVINSTILRYGGGQRNIATGTDVVSVLTLNENNSTLGSHVSITNNEFDDNSSSGGFIDAPIDIRPNSILATDPQRPLLSGNPFIHGNMFQRNGYNAVHVITPSAAHFFVANLLVNSTWTGGDYTYFLTGTIVLGPSDEGGLLPFPSSQNLLASPKPNVTLTLQSTLAGTVLADGSTVAAPGVPLVVKLQGGVANEAPGVNPPINTGPTAAYFTGGAGFIVGVDDGTDPPTPGETLIDHGAFSDIRILGIPANQSTGQTRVPVVITSIHDASYGTTVNGLVMNQAIPGDTTAPTAGDGGVIYFGGNSLTSYNLQDPRSGNFIDNADIRYITRIEQQGGGIVYAALYGTDTAFNPLTNFPFTTKLGLQLPGAPGYLDQYNQAKNLTISNSNLFNFSDVGFVAHPGYGAIVYAQGAIIPLARVTTMVGEPTHTYFVNDTITGMQAPGGRKTGIEIISELGDDATTNPGTVYTNPAEAVVLNTTFYGDGIGINAVGSPPDGNNQFSHVALLAMDNIFSNINGFAVQGSGQLYGTDLQYNLFNAVNGGLQANAVSNVPNNQPIFGDPMFRNPAAGNFFLQPNSAAIDRARSELGPSIFGDMLFPTATIDPNNLNALPIRNQIGDSNPYGGFAPGRYSFIPSDADIVTLPGQSVFDRGFPDLWIPTLGAAVPGAVVPATGSASSTPGTFGTSGNAATYAYSPIQGERDQAGNLRVKDPNSPNVGFGRLPFFDIGAFEYIIQNPPVVTAALANVPIPPTPVNLYTPGGIAGTNQVPTSIQVAFNEQLDPNTITASSVLLLASGGDGIFGNNNSPGDRAISLAGRLIFDPKFNVLTIITTGLFPNPALLNDEYELVLKGTGSAVIKDRSGLPLDGFTAGDTLPLPSGSDQFPGSDFVLNFTIDTNAPALVAGTFKLSPNSDSSGGLNITNVRTPTFIGTITDVFPPLNFLAGDRVFIDISTKGDGVFDLLNAGVGTTDANGNFAVALTTPLPESPFVVNPVTGIQGVGDTGQSLARVRVINQAGNVSASPAAPLSTFISTGALTIFEEDYIPPQVTSISPASNILTAPDGNGQVIVTVTFDKNIKETTLNSSSVLVFRAGGGGVFAGGGVQVPIVPGSFTFNYLHTPRGAVTVTFALQGPLPNDLYRIVLKGTGTSVITDRAGNPLDGARTGTPGSDFVNGPFVVFTPANSRLIYVDGTNPLVGVADGTRALPYRSITAGLAAAKTGDVVLVLPGTYYEDINLKAQVRLLSADPASTDAGYLPGNQFDTLIYGVPPAVTTPPTATSTIVVNAQGISAIPGIITEISGFSIIAPLLGDRVLGAIDPTSSAVLLSNSNVLVDKNYIVNAGLGVNIVTTGTLAPTPQVESNVIAGNTSGVGISDTNSTVSLAAPTDIINNTIVDNTYGLFNMSATPNSVQARVFNNIFYSNHELTTARAGTGIISLTVNTLLVGSNLFYQNGPTNAVASNALGTFVGFNPALLKATPDASGNISADPAFVSARDPRPNGDTPPVFFLDGDFDLTARSTAINAGLQSVAPATDILYRTPVRIPGKGFNGTGPASMGAFYYRGAGGIAFNPGNGTSPVNAPIGRASITPGSVSTRSASSANPEIGGSLPIGTKKFSVVDAMLSSEGTAAAPSYIDVDFSDNIKAGTVIPSDLILRGPGLSATNPARATGLSWVDNHTIRFFLTGDFNAAGTVNVAVPQGSLTDTRGDSLVGYHGSFQVGSSDTTGLTPVATTVRPGSGSVTIPAAAALATSGQPLAVAGPVAVHYGSSKHPAAKKAHAAKPKPGHPAQAPTAHHATAKPAAHHAAKPAPKAKKGK